MQMRGLVGKVAIVTGAGRGIGRAIALALSKENAKLVVSDINGTTAQQTADEIRKLGRQAVAVKTNVTSDSEVERMVNRTMEEFGKVDMLVNNAGVIDVKPFEEITEEEWDSVMNVNVKGVFLCSQHVAKQMIRQRTGGRIVNIASNAGQAASPRMCHYVASKHAVVGLTKAIAVDLAPYKINVNAICPGDVQTEMHSKILRRSLSIQGRLLRRLIGNSSTRSLWAGSA